MLAYRELGILLTLHTVVKVVTAGGKMLHTFVWVQLIRNLGFAKFVDTHGSEFGLIDWLQLMTSRPRI